MVVPIFFLCVLCVLRGSSLQADRGRRQPVVCAPGAIRGNVFGVDCTPDDVGTYGLDADANAFIRSRSNCRDTLASLEELAKGGNPDWRLRLAAAQPARSGADTVA